MPRSTRDSRLETRSARLRLSAGDRHYRGISGGLALAYRRSKKGYGSWYARQMVKPGKYVHTLLGPADDTQDADGTAILSYFHAQEKARQLAAARQQAKLPRSYTVKDAMDDYLKWFATHRKSHRGTAAISRAHIEPTLGHKVVDRLTSPEIRQWHEALAAAPPRIRKKQSDTGPAFKKVDTNDPDYQRRRRYTANRVLTILKAALNMAFRDERAQTDLAWRRVKPFRATASARIRFLSLDECTRLLNTTQGAFRQLVKGALLTGARYGELMRMRCDDFVIEGRCVRVNVSKSGRPRTIPLTEEGMDFFTAATAGKLSDQLIFTRDDGTPWGNSHQSRPLADACRLAMIQPRIGFNILRHTYGSHLAMAAVPLQAIAAVLGHSDTRITEKHYAHLQPSFVADTVRSALPSFEIPETKKVIVPFTSRAAA